MGSTYWRLRGTVFRSTPKNRSTVIVGHSERDAALKLIALRELLEDIPWTHRVDVSFQAERRVTSTGRARLEFFRRLCAAPRSYGPAMAWMIPEPHPTNPGRWHMHGLWRVPAAQLWRGWWRCCKEWWGSNCGWTRVWALPVGNKAALGKAVSYAAKHHVKTHPIAWHRFETRYTRTVDSPPAYTMAYWAKGGKRMELHIGQGQ